MRCGRAAEHDRILLLTTRQPVTLRYRMDVAARLIAALAGGYAIASLVAVACAWTLPMERIEAAMTGTMLGLLAMPVAAMGCFWARSAARAWAGTLLVALILAGIAMIGGWRP